MAYCTWFVKWRLTRFEGVDEYDFHFSLSKNTCENSSFQWFSIVCFRNLVTAGCCEWVSSWTTSNLWRRIWKHQCCRRRVKSYTKPWLQVTSMYWDLPFSYPNHNSEPSRREMYLFFWTPTKTRSQQKQLRECCGLLRIRSLQEVKSKCIPCFA